MSIQFAPKDGIASRAIAARDENGTTLPAMIQRAAHQLASAVSAAEVLDARDMASVAYDAAKKAARLARAKGAHDELIAKAHRAQADALEIEAAAKRRLADEYDAAQDRGDVAKRGNIPEQNVSTLADIGLTAKDVHEARQIRDAELADPGIVKRTVEEQLEAGHEPTKAAVRKAIDAVNNKDEKMDVAVIEPQEVTGRTGPRINFPAGVSPEDIARQGMAREANGETAEVIAKSFGIGTHSHRKLCDIVFLADREGYTAKDADITARALAMVNETQRVVDAWDLVSPVATKVWGDGISTIQRSIREEARLDRFEHVAGIIEQTCASAAEMDVPYLSADAAKAAVRELKTSRQNLQILINRIEGLHS